MAVAFHFGFGIFAAGRTGRLRIGFGWARHEVSLYHDRGGDLWIINPFFFWRLFCPDERIAHITTSSDMKPFLGTDGHTFSWSRTGNLQQATETSYTQRKMRPLRRHIATRSLQPGIGGIEATLDAPAEEVGVPNAHWLSFSSLAHNRADSLFLSLMIFVALWKTSTYPPRWTTLRCYHSFLMSSTVTMDAERVTSSMRQA